ncbi:MAG: glycosyltransferase involved in cell wall biosynthesis [Candidatus Latescibacterota bacterium]|jgi:glycosyltransferase involved in cell wall biosynthesis
MQKRILYIGNKPSQGTGTVTTIETLSLLLTLEGYEVVTASAAKNKAHRLIAMLATTLKYRNKVDYVLIDTYSTLNFTYAVLVAKLCRRFKIPYIPILHGGDLPNRLVKSPKASTMLFGNAYVNVAPSQFLMHVFKNAGFNNISYIPNAIEIKNYPFMLRKEIKPELLWVRSFSKVYHPMLALEILQKLLLRYPNASLLMVGPEKDGSLSECKELARRENLPVYFTGRLEKEKWISQSVKSSIFINTTNVDNMPVSVLEAMALGLPVISTGVGGMTYLIENDVDGILAPPNNAEVFVKEIEKLIQQPDVAINIAKNARIKVEHFDWQQVKHSWNLLLNN